MRDLYDRVAELLDQGRKFIIAHLVEAKVSAPQRPGAKLIVHPDGAMEFTIGGGTLEAWVTEEASMLLQDGGTMVKGYELKDLGMSCGGAVKILYDLLGGTAEERRFYRKARELLEQERRFVIAYLINTVGEGSKLLISPNGTVESISKEVPPKLMDVIKRETQALLSAGKGGISFSYPEEEAELFLELVEGPPRLLIFGAGHIGRKLAELAAATGIFQVEVADDRADSINAIKGFADRVYLVERDYLEGLPLPDGRTFVAIITRSHQTDQAVLQRLLGWGKTPAYLGMIGSVNKRVELFRMLIEEGIAEEQLQQVHMPIGLPLGGKEPGEIAVSVLAEIIKTKNALEER